MDRGLSALITSKFLSDQQNVLPQWRHEPGFKSSRNRHHGPIVKPDGSWFHFPRLQNSVFQPPRQHTRQIKVARDQDPEPGSAALALEIASRITPVMVDLAVET